MKIFIKFEYSHFGYSKSILYISTWYTSCYLQVKTNATQAELTHAIIIIILILIMPWLYNVVVCEYIWFRFMVRQPKFGNIITEKILYSLRGTTESRGSLMWKGKELKRCMTNWWFACIWLRATNRHKHSFWHLVL